jgi:hypothetical protein
VSKTTKVVAVTGLRLFAVVMGWILLITGYFLIYDLFERNSVPVSVGPKGFYIAGWDAGYFSASGSFSNDSAVTPGDELALGTAKIICVRETNTCTIATAIVYDGFLGLDSSSYDIKGWNDRFIYFEDKSSICAEQYYSIDRVTQSVSYLSKKKDVIPDYALNSPLKPCNFIVTMNVTLKDGFQVYWHKLKNYERENGIYFHTALILVNLGYVGVVLLLWRRKPRLMRLEKVD